MTKSSSRLSPWTAAVCLLGLIGAGCSKTPQEKAARYLEEGRQYRAKRDHSSALIAFRNAARETPADPEPQYLSGLVFLETHETTSAAHAFQSVLAIHPNHIGARLKLAELMIASSDKQTLEAGAKSANQVLASHGGNPDAISAAALAELRLGNPAAAAKKLKQAIEKHPAHPGIVLNLARSLTAQGDMAGAEKALKDGIAASPGTIDLILPLADFYLQRKAFHLAEEQYRRAIVMDPDHGAALLALGSLHSRNGKHAEAQETFTKLSKTPDKRYRASLAAYLLQQGKEDLAKAELERVFQSDPENKEIRNTLLNLYLAKNEIAKAEQMLGKALARSPNDPGALLQQARVCLMKGEYEKAEEIVNQVLHRRADSSEAHFLLAKVHRTRGSMEATRKELNEALRLEPKMLAARLELSQLLRGSGGARTALALLDAAPAEQKQIAAVLLERNWVLFELGRGAEAKPVIESILKSAALPEALLQKTALQVETREYLAAKSSLDELLLKAPDDVRVLHLIEQTYTGLKDTEGGLRRIEKHVAQRAGSPELKAFLGHWLLALGEKERARTALDAAVGAAPEILKAQLDLVDLDTAEGKLESALSRLHKVAGLDRDGSIHVRIASLEDRRGNHARAMEKYRAALGLNPTNIQALNNLAYLVVHRDGNPDEALKYAERAKELAPKDPAVDDTLGWTYYRKGLYSLAVRHLELSTAKEKTAKRLFHLSMAHYKNGNESRGRVALDAALRLDANLPEAALARELFKGTPKANGGQAR